LKLHLQAGLVIAALLALTMTAANLPREIGESARAALNHGRADEALRLLDTSLAGNASDAEALNLRCRVLLAEEHWDEAIASCGRSVEIASGNSNYHLWLGRAYGEKADHVSFVTAYKMARLIRAEFEQAASLDPQNGPALSDLGQYYVEAPAVLGGGTNKAEAVAGQLDAFAPDRAHELRARIAEKKKDYATAENEFRAEISASASISPNGAAQSWMDLGSFYRRRHRWSDMLTALQMGAAADTRHGPSLADGASTLIKAKREPQLAAEWMREYLSGNALSEDAPAFSVHARLGDLYKSEGDEQAAAAEYAAVHALASNFAVASRAKVDTDR
jgi:tetratricopeptide (TPR) repeat protein